MQIVLSESQWSPRFYTAKLRKLSSKVVDEESNIGGEKSEGMQVISREPKGQKSCSLGDVVEKLYIGS